MGSYMSTETRNEDMGTDTAVEPGPSGSENDEIVGLEMADGSIFYCRRSSMASAEFLSHDPVKHDGDRRSIYFVGASSERFQSHILPCLLSNKAPLSQDPEFLRVLSEEAAYYGVDDLVATLDAKLVSNSDIVGLEFTDGRICYCHRSTLANAAGSYFASRFGGTFADGVNYHDSRGQPVYFVERSGELYEKYILPYLLTGSPGQLPRFSQNPELWHEVRKEAEFYVLDGLSAVLYVMHTCKPNNDNRGILYWKGTKKGKSDEHKNPNETGAVHVGGWVDKLTT